MTQQELDASYEELSRLADELRAELELAHGDRLQRVLTQLGHVLAGGPLRFRCGQVTYTLKEPFSPPRLRAVCADLAIEPGATRDQIERRLHLRFQTLFRKPSYAWTQEEQREWDTILSYIDFEAYQLDNPVLENRIGLLLQVGADKVVISWITRGKQTHDARDVPPEVLTATPGYRVHALFGKRSGPEKWLSVRLEPPNEPEQEIMDADKEDEARSPTHPLAPARWPKVRD